jgi:diadenosine tetraphosphate (Ap4A) HIT family hydrolase
MALSIAERIKLARQGEYPNLIAHLRSGWVIAADTQPVFGYCLLLADPSVKSFNELNESERSAYALDCGRVGDALMLVTKSYRINYETWGNLDPALHTHIVPRYLTEPESKRILPICKAYDIGSAEVFSAGKQELFLSQMRKFLKPFNV